MKKKVEEKVVKPLTKAEHVRLHDLSNENAKRNDPVVKAELADLLATQ